MQTFLPYPDFEASAKALDSRRLGKQRVEAWQIWLCLKMPNRWKNHPAVRMWSGYEDALAMYMNAMIDEWVARGFHNNMRKLPHDPNAEMPPWLGDPRFHRAQQSNLVRKDPAFYGPQFPDVAPDLLYFWPTKHPDYAEPVRRHKHA